MKKTKTPWFRKPRVERVLALGDLQDAIERSEEEHKPFADRCKHVRTASARKAHLLPPGGDTVLCGWPGAVYDASPDLEVCHMCRREALARDGLEAAS